MPLLNNAMFHKQRKAFHVALQGAQLDKIPFQRCLYATIENVMASGTGDTAANVRGFLPSPSAPTHGIDVRPYGSVFIECADAWQADCAGTICCEVGYFAHVCSDSCNDPNTSCAAAKHKPSANTYFLKTK